MSDVITYVFGLIVVIITAVFVILRLAIKKGNKAHKDYDEK